jgi:hypothetical protein
MAPCHLLRTLVLGIILKTALCHLRLPVIRTRCTTVLLNSRLLLENNHDCYLHNTTYCASWRCRILRKFLLGVSACPNSRYSNLVEVVG